MKMLIGALALSLMSATAHTNQLPQTISHSKGEFQLCDKERVSKLWFDIVDVGIYYPSCDTVQHIFDNQTKLLRFAYLREVEGQQFTKGAIEYLEQNLNPQELEYCSEHFSPLNHVYKDVTEGDYYDLYLFEDEGLTLYLNGKHLHDMPSKECHTPYLNVWFGEETMDSQFHDLSKRLKR
ncbi:chalcone isomerase family protein [Kangiella marina]|uniref:Chalcone isomerase domain-containing protein n=1 Tax=Kangiella marina TaxID=1079178 RepID=A0ABP8II03_9GAMM